MREMEVSRGSSKREPAKGLIRTMYPRTKSDIYAAFIERDIGLLVPGGFLGALTSRTYLHLSSFRPLREEVLLREAPPVALLDLGFGILDGAAVETAAVVVRRY